MDRSDAATTAAGPRGRDGPGRPSWRVAAHVWRRVPGRLVWLAYLPLYFTPWFAQAPSRLGLLVSLAGTAVFLAVYAHALVRRGRSVLPHVLAMAAIGFALSPFGGAWSVFNVYAASLAGRMQPRRSAVITLVLLNVVLVAFGLGLRIFWPVWVSGVFFGAMTGFSVVWQSDLERTNRRLEAAQDEVRVLAASAERERIGRDLHDLLGHTLTLVTVKADLAARLADRDAAAAKREMEEVAAVARDALTEVRTAVAGMRGASLAAELERARRMLTAADVEARISHDAALDDPRREAVLAMALREAVTNVIRHAGATRCTIDVDVPAPESDGSGGEYRLSVADDGGGGAIREGSGLSGMRTRLEAAGGALEVRSDADGVRLVARLPTGAAA